MLAIVLLTSFCLAGCGTNKAQRSLNEALADKAKANAAQVALRAADKAITEARRMPTYPPECLKEWRSGTKLGDRLDVSNVKYDQALGGANGQIRWCGEWYLRNWKAREPK